MNKHRRNPLKNRRLPVQRMGSTSISKNELLIIAEELAAKEEESSHRFATNRAFLFSYHVCLDFVKMADLRMPDNGGGTHARLLESLMGSDNPNIRNLGELLKKARAHRVIADYKLRNEFSQRKAQETIAYARLIRDTAQSLHS